MSTNQGRNWRGKGRGTRGNFNRSNENNQGGYQYPPRTPYFPPPTAPQMNVPSQFSYPPPPLPSSQPQFNYSAPRFSAQQNNVQPPAQGTSFYNNPIAESPGYQQNFVAGPPGYQQNFIAGPPGFQQYQPTYQYANLPQPAPMEQQTQASYQMIQPVPMQNLAIQSSPSSTQEESTTCLIPCMYPDLNKFEQSVGMDGTRKMLPVFYYCTSPEGGFLMCGKNGCQEEKNTSPNNVPPSLELVHHVSCSVTSSGDEMSVIEEIGGTSETMVRLQNGAANGVLNDNEDIIENNEARDEAVTNVVEVVEEPGQIFKSTSLETIYDLNNFKDALSDFWVAEKNIEEPIENMPTSSDREVPTATEYQVELVEKNTEEAIIILPTSSDTGIATEPEFQLVKNKKHHSKTEIEPEKPKKANKNKKKKSKNTDQSQATPSQ